MPAQSRYSLTRAGEIALYEGPLSESEHEVLEVMWTRMPGSSHTINQVQKFMVDYAQEGELVDFSRSGKLIQASEPLKIRETLKLLVQKGLVRKADL